MGYRISDAEKSVVKRPKNKDINYEKFHILHANFFLEYEITGQKIHIGVSDGDRDEVAQPWIHFQNIDKKIVGNKNKRNRQDARCAVSE